MRCEKGAFLLGRASGLPAVKPTVILMDRMVVVAFLQPDVLVGQVSRDWNGPSSWEPSGAQLLSNPAPELRERDLVGGES